MLLRATGEVLKVEYKESRPGDENRWRMAIVRLLIGRADFADLVMMENREGRFEVTVPKDGDHVDYAVEVAIRPAKGAYPAQVGTTITGHYEGTVPLHALPAASKTGS